jgi:hypothetical protein
VSGEAGKGASLDDPGSTGPCAPLSTFLSRSTHTATAEDLRRLQLHLVDTGTGPVTINATITGEIRHGGWCVFQRSATARFGIVIAEFGNVTVHFGDVTGGRLAAA